VQFCVIKHHILESPITRQEFEAQAKMLKRVLEIVEGFAASGDFMSKEIWDNADLKRYLNISTSTIKRARDEGIFKTIPGFKRPRYYRKDILPHRDQFLK